MANASDTLMHVFESGALAWPDMAANGDACIVWLNAAPPAVTPLSDAHRAIVVCEQGSKATSVALRSAGMQAEPDLDAGALSAPVAMVLVSAGQHRDENRRTLRRAACLCAAGGRVIVAGAKTQGIASLRKWVASHVPVEGSLSKHHGQAFWFDGAHAAAQLPDTPGLARQEHGALAAPGMFSHEKVDAGSALLLPHALAHARGHVADFGCGWGSLAMALAKAPKVTGLACFEDHWPSLEAARRNMETTGFAGDLQFHWHDLEHEPVERRFDTVITNPPFHTGGAQRRSLGEAFIRCAANALKPNGVFVMVANTGLAYEPTLEATFRRVDLLERAAGFKILRAVR